MVKKSINVLTGPVRTRVLTDQELNGLKKKKSDPGFLGPNLELKVHGFRLVIKLKDVLDLS
jgi:hypothetical protein